MKITIVGTGYVGLVTGTCFAEFGHLVTCVDKDAKKVELMRQGKSPIYEAGLDELLKRQIELGRLDFSLSLKDSIAGRDAVFIAVGTPTSPDGTADLRFVHAVADEIATCATVPLVVVTKSTVPVGTTDSLDERINSKLKSLGRNFKVELANNPEFLREGSAVRDTLEPDRVVIGARSKHVESVMQQIYAPLIDRGVKLFATTPPSSEMAKYAANSMLAARISIMNEFALVCEKVGADIEFVREAIGADSRIGPAFLRAGVGFGGSCFPKDLAALIQTSKAVGEESLILRSVVQVNSRQRQLFLQKIIKHNPKRVAIWGLAFKPGTDDVRDAPALEIIRGLLQVGVEVVAHDPRAGEFFKREFGEHPKLRYSESSLSALEGADVLVLLTEWPEYLTVEPKLLAQLLLKKAVFDGRNTRQPEDMTAAGLKYVSIGRPEL